MLKCFAPMLLAAELAVAPLAVTQPDDYTLLEKTAFSSSPLSAFVEAGTPIANPSLSGLKDMGVFYLSSDVVYSSVSEFPKDIPDDFTAFVVSGQVPTPQFSDSRISSSSPQLQFIPTAGGANQNVRNNEQFPLVAIRCVYYNGSVVSATTPCPLFVRWTLNADTGRYNYIISFYYMEGVTYPSWSASIGWPSSSYFSNYLVPCLPSALDFVPVNPDIDGGDTLGTLYRLGQLLVNDAQNVSGFLNFKIFGYPLYQLILVTGFYLVAGWTVLRFIVP